MLRTSLKGSLFRNSFFILATAIVSYALGFLFWLVVARSYPEAAVGTGVALFSTLLFLAGVANAGLPLGLIRFLPEARDKRSLVNASMTLTGLIAVALGLVFLVGLPVWAPDLGFVTSDAAFAAIYLLSLLGFVWGGLIDSAFVAARRAEFGLIRNLVYYLLRLPFPPIVAGLLGVVGIVLSWTVALLISLSFSALLLLPRLFKGYRPNATWEGLRGTRILGYSLWNQASVVVSGSAWSLLPLLILVRIGGEGGAAATAHFYAAFALASALYVVPISFSTSLFAEGSHPGTDYAQNARATTRLSLALLALGIVAAIVFGSPILALFGDGYAREGYPMLILLVLTSPIVLANTVLTTELRVAKRVRSLFTIAAASSAATLVSAYALVSSAGIWGAGLGLLLGQALALPLFIVEKRANGRVIVPARELG